MFKDQWVTSFSMESNKEGAVECVKRSSLCERDLTSCLSAQMWEFEFCLCHLLAVQSWRQTEL